MAVKYPLWKKRQLQAKAEREAAERKASYDAFWEAVEKRPRLIQENEDTWVRPIEYDEGLPIG